jgi:hypothetical protein
LFQEADAQIIAVADPITEMNLDAFYFKGLAGRGPVKAEIEKHYADRTPNFRCAAYEDFRVMLEKEPGIDAVLCATPAIPVTPYSTRHKTSQAALKFSPRNLTRRVRSRGRSVIMWSAIELR